MRFQVFTAHKISSCPRLISNFLKILSFVSSLQILSNGSLFGATNLLVVHVSQILMRIDSPNQNSYRHIQKTEDSSDLILS